MNYPVHAILILGKYGAGKTDFSDYLKSRLSGEHSIRVPIEFSSDRIFIEEEVLRDVNSANAKEKGKIGEFSTLYKPDAPPGLREFGVIDGTLHRYAHNAMIKSIRSMDRDTLKVFEIGIGPDVVITTGRQPLMQSGDFFLNLIRKEQIASNIMVIEVDAPYEVRSGRNRRRTDPVPEEVFAIAAKDGGEFWKTQHGLGDRYVSFKNEIDDSKAFLERAEEIVTASILPQLRGEGPKKTSEGRPRGPFHLER